MEEWITGLLDHMTILIQYLLNASKTFKGNIVLPNITLFFEESYTLQDRISANSKLPVI
jgi:hypothetical protein